MARPWTTSELARLRRLAGTMPLRQVCYELRRSHDSVRGAARRYGVDLSYYEPIPREVCPMCGSAREHWSKREGICSICNAEHLTERCDAQMAEVFALLPAKWQELYADTEAELESRPPEKPEAPRTRGLGRVEAARAIDRHMHDMEEWELAYKSRVLKARYRRLGRMREKLPRTES